jgi:hypothetical protein
MELLLVYKLVKKFYAFYGTDGLLSRSQELATGPNPEPDKSGPRPHTQIFRHILMLSCHHYIYACLPSDFSTKVLYAFLTSHMRATCPAHLILLDLITVVMLGKWYKILSSLLCNFLHSVHYAGCYIIICSGRTDEVLFSCCRFPVLQVLCC